MTQAGEDLLVSSGGTGFSEARLARIGAFFEREVEAARIPGAVLQIEQRGKVLMRQAWGFRDRGAGTAMTPDTIFRIYSMTKPIVSVATMMLAGEGRLTLSQPVSDFIPAFAGLAVLKDGRHVAATRGPSIHDLLRHTSGLTYQSNGGPVGDLYAAANLFNANVTNEAFAEAIARLPLAYEPGTVWDYGHSTDVLGRVLEVVSGRSLSSLLRELVLTPLGMAETGFWVADPAKHGRIAEAHEGDTINGRGPLFDPRRPRAFEAGGMGLVSTLDDYARFARMLLAGGRKADGHVLLSEAMLRFMASDHIGPSTGIAKLPSYMPGAGFGFGLGFAVRLETGAAAFPGSVGEFNWSGVAGTYFWIDPACDLFVVFLCQAPRERLRLRAALKTMVYDALVGCERLSSPRLAVHPERPLQPGANENAAPEGGV